MENKINVGVLGATGMVGQREWKIKGGGGREGKKRKGK